MIVKPNLANQDFQECPLLLLPLLLRLSPRPTIQNFLLRRTPMGLVVVNISSRCTTLVVLVVVDVVDIVIVVVLVTVTVVVVVVVVVFDVSAGNWFH